MKLFCHVLGLNNTLSQVLTDKLVVNETLDYQLLPLPLRRLQVYQRTHLVHMKLHWLLVVERVEVNIELISDKLLNMLELSIEKIHKDLRISHNIWVLNLGTDNQTVEQILHLLMKILLLFVLNILKIKCFLTHHLRRKYTIRLHTMPLKLFNVDLPTLHHLLHQLTTVNTTDRTSTPRLLTVLQLEVLHLTQNLQIHLHLNYLPLYNSVGLQRLVLVNSLIDLINLPGLFLNLQIFFPIAAQFLIYRV